jgi:hypothetical protein
MQTFLNNNTDSKQWQQGADYLKGLVKNNAEAAQAELRSSLYQVFNTIGWHSFRYAYTFSQMESGELIALCEAKTLNWQIALNAKACFGTAEEVQRIYHAGKKYDYNFNLNDALGYSCRSLTILPGMKSPGNFETTEALFKLGAAAGHDSGNLFERAVDDCGIEMGRLFGRYGLIAQIMTNKMAVAQSSNKPLLYRQLREIYWDYGRYAVTDHETLVENKIIDGGSTQMKIIFNFASRRVREILEWPTTNKAFLPVVNDFPFDSYGAAAIENARLKLIELGGRPSGDTGILAGKTVIKPLGGSKFPKENP